MDFLTVAVIAFVSGAVLMGILTSNERIEESMKQFNAGYEKGLEDGKRMKGEKDETKRD